MPQTWVRGGTGRRTPLWGVVQMGGALPVIDARADFEIPEGLPFRYAGVSCSPTARVATVEGRTSYRFRLERLPGVNLAEPLRGGAGPCRLHYSTAEGWETVSDWLQARIDTATAPDPVLSDRAARIDVGKEAEAGGFHASDAGRRRTRRSSWCGQYVRSTPMTTP